MKAIVITFEETEEVSDNTLASRIGKLLIDYGILPESLSISILTQSEVCDALLKETSCKKECKNKEDGFKKRYEDFGKYCDIIISALRKHYKNPKQTEFQVCETTKRVILTELMKNDKLKDIQMLKLIKYPTIGSRKVLNEKHLEFLLDWINDILIIYDVMNYDREI